ncbi:MAG TPA: alpha/beta fold hydrolase [Noviherbaspirillum sp.]|nr:alpha/beta fold hydrolase [Noviherbaspirillum sp.]
MHTPHRIHDTDIYIEGNGPQTIVMVHGWPDTWRLWDRQVAALKGRFRCVRFSLPGYEPGSPRRAASLDDIVSLMRAIADEVNGGQPVILLLHDWGCVFGYQFALRHPELVSRVIGIDIGDAGSPDHLRELPLLAKLGIAGYQLWLALAWRIGGALGTRMTRWMAGKARCPTDPAMVHAGMNYPYDIAWTGSHGSYRHVLPMQPTWPLLFLYGRRKPLKFHSRAWLDKLRADPWHRVLGFEMGHWVQVEQPEAVNAAIIQWLDDGQSCKAA